MSTMNWSLLIPSAGLVLVALVFAALTSFTRGRREGFRVALFVVAALVGVALLLVVVVREGSS